MSGPAWASASTARSEGDVRIPEDSIIIERPLAEVFAFVSDTANDPTWHTSVVEGKRTSTGPVGLGATYEGTYDSHRQTLTTPPDPTNYQRVRAVVVDYVVDRAVTIHVEFLDPPRGMLARVLGKQFDLSFRFEAVSGGTRVYRAGELNPVAIVRPLMPLLMRRMKTRNRYLLGTLKAAFEGGASPVVVTIGSGTA